MGGGRVGGRILLIHKEEKNFLKVKA